MKRVEKRALLGRLCCWLFLLLLVNGSIDPPDMMTPSGKSHRMAAINEQESLSELIAEDCFSLELPDDEETDTESSNGKLLLYFIELPSHALPLPFLPRLAYPTWQERPSELVVAPHSPPPRQA
jgi:hypothetical protein